MLRKILDDMAPNFEKGGKHEKWYALYEAVDTIFYMPSTRTSACLLYTSPSPRDATLSRMPSSA